MVERLTFRRWVLFVSLALMEAAWVGVYAPLLVPALGSFAPVAVLLLLWAFIGLYAMLGRALLLSSLEDRRLYVTLIAVPLLSYLLFARVLLFPGEPLLAWRWLGRALWRPLYVIHPGPELGLLLFTLLVWWRALGVTQMPVTLTEIGLRFRVQILALVLGIILSVTQHLGDPVLYVWAFFLGALMSLALVRVEDVGELAGTAGRAFDRTWVVITAAMTGLIVAVSALLARVVTLENIAGVYPHLQPLFRLVGRLLFLMAVAIGWVVGTVVLYLIHLLFGETKIELNLSPITAPQGPPPKRPPPVRWESPWLQWLAAHAEIVGGAVALFIVLLFIALGVRREIRRRQMVREEEIRVGSMDEVAADVGAGMRSLLGRLRDAWHLLRHYGPGTTFLSALSVHNIYINLLRLSAQRGYARRRAETPYEHLARVVSAYPDVREDMQAIVDAFVAAHYGDLDISEAELETLRRAWERIQDALAEQ